MKFYSEYAGLQQYISDPAFKKLSPEAQIEVLNKVDKDFNRLSQQAKVIVLQKSLKATEQLPRQFYASDPRFQPQTAGYPRFMPSAGREIIQKGAETIAEHPRESLAIAGNIIGMIGGPAASMAGGVVGSAIGKAIEIEPRPGELRSEAIKRGLARGMIIGGAEEAAGWGGEKIIGRVLSPFGKYVSKEARTAINTLREYMPKKISGGRLPPITMAQATEFRPLDWINNIAESAALVQMFDTFGRYERVQQKAVQALTEDFVKSFPEISPTDLGETVSQLLDIRWKDFNRIMAKPYYNTVAELAPNAQINIKPLKEWAEKKVESLKVSIRPGSSGANLIKMILKLEDTIPYTAAKEIRSDLGEEAFGKIFSEEGQRLKGLSTRAYEIMTNQIGDGLQTDASKRAYNIWKEANRVYHSGKDIFRNKTIMNFMRKAEDKPVNALQAIFAKKGTTGIRRIKNVIGPEEWEKVQGWYIRQLLEEKAFVSTKEGLEYVSGQKMKTQLRAMGDETLQEIFEPAKLKRLNDFATTLYKAQEKQPKKGGSMLIQLMQAGSLASIAYGKMSFLTGYDYAILIAPEIFSRMLLSPTANKILLNSIKLPKGSRIIPSTIFRLTKLAEGIEQKITAEKRKELEE